MKKALFIMPLLLLGLFFIFGYPASAVAADYEYVVNQTGWFPGDCLPADCNIVQAIDASNADGGSSLITFDLTYPATINALTDWPLFITENNTTIQGPGAENLEINGSGFVDGWSGISVTGDNASISGLTIENFLAQGIWVQDASGAVIFDNIIHDSDEYGVAIQGAGGNNSVLNNTIENNYDRGIELDDTVGHNIISDNTLAGNHEDGIHTGSWDAGYNTISDNTISGSQYGFHLVNSNNIISGNTFSDNSTYGLFINGEGAINNSVTGNTFSDFSDGIPLYLYDSSGNTFQNNTYSNNAITYGGNGYYADLSKLVYGSHTYGDYLDLQMSTFVPANLYVNGSGDITRVYESDTYLDGVGGNGNFNLALVDITPDGSSHAYMIVFISPTIADNATDVKAYIDANLLGAPWVATIDLFSEDFYIAHGPGENYTYTLPAGVTIAEGYYSLENSMLAYDGVDYSAFAVMALNGGSDVHAWFTANPTPLSGLDGTASLNIGLCNLVGDAGLTTVYLDDSFGVTSIAELEALLSGFGIPEVTCALYQEDVLVSNGAQQNFTVALPAGVTIVGGGELTLNYSVWPDLALDYKLADTLYIRSAVKLSDATDNDFSAEIFVDNGNNVHISGVTGGNSFSDLSISGTLGQDVILTTSEGTDSWVNSPLATYALEDGLGSAMSGGQLDVKQNLKACVANQAGAALSDIAVEFSGNIGVTDNGTTGADGCTSYILLDSYAIGSGGLINDRNPFTVSASLYGNTSSQEITLDGPSKEVSIEIGDDLIVATPHSKSKPKVRLLDRNGNVVSSFYAYSSKRNGEVKATKADVTGDGIDEIITVPGKGLAGELKVFTQSGTLLSKSTVYSSKFKGGLNLAVGDFDKDGKNEIAVAPESDYKPLVKVYDYTTKLKTKTTFYAYDKSYKGGVNLVATDMNNDTKDEIVVAPLSADDPIIKVYYIKSGKKFKKLTQASVFPATHDTGLDLVKGDINEDNKDEIIVAPKIGSTIKAYQLKSNKLKLVKTLKPYGASFGGTFSLASGDVNNDGRDELVVAKKSGNKSKVYVYKYASKKFNKVTSFTPYAKGGANLTTIDIDFDGKDEVVVTPFSGNHKTVIYNISAKSSKLKTFYVFGASFKGGINLE